MTRRVRSGDAELAVHETGDPALGPTIVLVHGYPDTHAVWDELVALLADRFHVVTYDVRGIGASTAPDGDRGFRLEQLARDLAAVVDAVSPGRAVHLVGHDWGAFQCWEALTGGVLAGRIASFTAVAGPRVDRARDWVVHRLRPRPGVLGQLAGQARRSWYIAAAQLPALPELVTRRGMARTWPAAMRRLEGIEPRPGHPAATLGDDAARGLALYRTNARRLVRSRGDVPADVPVLLIVPTRDPFISAAMYADADEWAPRIWRRDIRAGHWVQRSYPGPVARWIAELVDHAAPPSALRRSFPVDVRGSSSTNVTSRGTL